MKKGFTTGSCAAAAARAAAEMLFTKKMVDKVSIETPAGVVYDAKIEDAYIADADNPGAHISGAYASDGGYASCAVRKYSGDDPDVTNNMLIYAKASFVKDENTDVIIKGGQGIGTVTRPGLDRPVGDVAINTVPRMMIDKEVHAVMDAHECADSVCIEIYAPEGEKIATSTFNPRLGIKGGISIIGTTGIVEPMSTRALIDTIRVELNQKKQMGLDTAVVSPGNYGLDFMKNRFGYDLDKAVKCSNFIGETIDIAKELGYEALLLVGHVGKLIKVSGGIMNTHSKEADCRMELMAAAAVKAGAGSDVAAAILDCVSTEEAYGIMLNAGIEKESFRHVMERISFYLNKRAGEMKTGCIVYSNEYGLLGMTDGAERMLDQ
ncbi:MAG: cobalt-precorrin-5B (C(1))-methyltransferase CbiD [Lachnospiraceae bacterium]|nr:cobalt-precorrin-5B (C(1))-methyltransferase CbiD [Lachnospiraceae bacterium]